MPAMRRSASSSGVSARPGSGRRLARSASIKRFSRSGHSGIVFLGVEFSGPAQGAMLEDLDVSLGNPQLPRGLQEGFPFQEPELEHPPLHGVQHTQNARNSDNRG